MEKKTRNELLAITGGSVTGILTNIFISLISFTRFIKIVNRVSR